MNDVDRLQLEILGGESRADRTLNVIAATNSVDIRIASIGDRSGGVGRRDHGQHRIFVDLRSRESDAGIEMADDQKNVRIGDDVPGVGNAHFRFRLIVKRHKDQIESKRLEPLARLLDRELRAELDVFT